MKQNFLVYRVKIIINNPKSYMTTNHAIYMLKFPLKFCFIGKCSLAHQIDAAKDKL